MPNLAYIFQKRRQSKILDESLNHVKETEKLKAEKQLLFHVKKS